MDNEKNLIEAALFVSSRPLSASEISDVVHTPRKEVCRVLDSMAEDYENHGIRLYYNVIRQTYELKVKEKYRASVSRLAPNQDLSRGVLQTLSIIAYKNPVRQSKIVSIRGNRAYEHLSELEDRGFVWRESRGHTKMVHVTKKFLDYFGLDTVEELKLYFQKSPAIEKFLEETQNVVEKGKIDLDSSCPDASVNVEMSKIGGLDPKIRREVEKRKKELGIMTLECEKKLAEDGEEK